MKKIQTVLLSVLFIVGLALPAAGQHPKSEPLDTQNGASGMKGSSMVLSDPEYIAVSGHVSFSKFTSPDKKVCGALLEIKKGKVICLLDNEKLGSLQAEMESMSGEVKVMGHLTKVASEEYLLLEDFQVLTHTEAKDSTMEAVEETMEKVKHKSSGSMEMEEHKGSGSMAMEQHKGSGSMEMEEHKGSGSMDMEEHKGSGSMEIEEHKGSGGMEMEEHKGSGMDEPEDADGHKGSGGMQAE